MPGIRKPGPIAPRFWKKVAIGSTKECWPWLASYGYRNYGKFKMNNTYVTAHRVAYELHYGPFDHTKFVCHTCDNPSCCNPHHLFLGTHKENMRDKVAKDRQAKGECCKTSKLSKDQINDLRELYLLGSSIKRLCRIFDLERHLVSRAIRGKGCYNG